MHQMTQWQETGHITTSQCSEKYNWSKNVITKKSTRLRKKFTYGKGDTYLANRLYHFQIYT